MPSTISKQQLTRQLHDLGVNAGVRYRRKKQNMALVDGELTRVEYGEVDHCCENFVRLNGWLEAQGRQRRGIVGHADARLIRSQDIVAVAREQLQQNETVFLHSPGVDEECDQARASIVVGWA